MIATPDIRALRSVTLGCQNLDLAHDFYTNAWGLETVERSDTTVAFRASGPEHHVLAFELARNNGLRHIDFAVATPADVHRAADHLIAAGLSIEHEPGPWQTPGGGYAVAFRDPEGRLVALVADKASVAPRPRLATPTELSHVVLNTVDIDAAVSFWVDILGFRISDWSEHQMAFLRCNSRHHSIAFNQDEWASINHIAYEVADLDAFMTSIGRLRHAGHTPLWGPGRHGPGNNAFAYYGDPVGYVPEVTTGLTPVPEVSWVPRVWQRVPDQSDLWGTAGPPSPEVRKRMSGAPDPAGADSNDAGTRA